MFGLFAPRPPLEIAGKALVEKLLNVLAVRLGPDRIGIGGPTPDTLLPSAELADVDGSDAAVAALVTRFAEHLGLDAAGLRVEWFDERPLAAEGTSNFALGTWRRDDGGPVIGLNASLRGDEDSLAATVAHELCHEVLLGRLSERDRGSQAGQLLEEPLTDLACAGLGLGLFPANATVREGPVQTDGGTGWGVRRSGYLTSRQLGYGLALLHHARGEPGDPSWLDELRPDAAEAVSGGLKYLRKTGDTLFTAQTAARGEPRPTAASILEGLRHRRPSRRLAAAWDAAEYAGDDLLAREPDLLDALLDAARDREADVRAAACGAVGTVCPAPADDREAWDRCLLALTAATDDATAAVRAAALRGLAEVPDLPAEGAAREELDRAVTSALAARTPAVRAAAAALLPRLPTGGEKVSPFAPAALKALIGALVRCSDAEAAEHAATLAVLHPDPAALVRDEVEDPELRLRVLDALGEEHDGELPVPVGPAVDEEEPTAAAVAG